MNGGILVKRLLFIYLVLFSSLINAQTPPTTGVFKKFIGTCLTFPLATSDTSVETCAYVDDLLKKIAPGEQLSAVRKFNDFGEYLLGRYNTVAIPFLNYLIINTRTLRKLPEEVQRFAVGRALYQMTNKDYFLYKYLLPYICDIYFEAKETDEEKELMASFTSSGLIRRFRNSRRLDGPENRPSFMETLKTDLTDSLKNLALHACAKLFIAYLSRSIEQEADTEVAQKLDCALGGVKYLKQYKAFATETNMGKIYSMVPFFEGLNFAVIEGIKALAPTWTERFRRKCSIAPYDITVARLHGNDFISYAKSCLPGQCVPYSNQLEHFIWNLPLLNYFSYYPTTSDRIAALSKLARTDASRADD